MSTKRKSGTYLLLLLLLSTWTPRATGEVIPNAYINGSQELYLTPYDRVEFQIGAKGKGTVECWTAIYSPFGWFSYNLGDGSWIAGLGNPYWGKVKDSPPQSILKVNGLPVGDYYLFFVMDEAGNGKIDPDSLSYAMAILHVREIWRPKPGTTWQWQLSGDTDLSYPAQVYDLDLFETSRETVSTLHRMGVKVICYLNAGAWEEWRKDAKLYPKEVLGSGLDGWKGERWIDIRRIDLLAPILKERIRLAAEKGCDGIEPDNIDGYTNETGFPLTYQDQLRFNKWLSLLCHSMGLSVGLKNDLEQVKDLIVHFDWALNESCFEYHECNLLTPFIQSGKAVFGVEYSGDPADFCPRANSMGFSWMKKHLQLDAWREACWEYEEK